MKIKIINGVNLNMLGIREKNIYGNATYDDLVAYVQEKCAKMNVELEFFQSNCEGEIVDAIQACYFDKLDGIVINAGAYTHYSYAILDAIKAVMLPCVEVHISDIAARENFRHLSVIEPACICQIKGKGFDGYVEGVEKIVEKRNAERN
ncbi:MAG: type II 3-dehydroquinate dehydratase [Clostridia bacterium]